MNRKLWIPLLGLAMLVGCYTPQTYEVEVWLDLNDLEVLSKQGKVEKRSRWIDTDVGDPPFGPNITIHYYEKN